MDEVIPMRILLADNHPKVQLALRVLLEQQSGYEVVGEAGDVVDLLIQLSVICPDLLLLAWELPGPTSIELLPAIRRICPTLPIIAISERLEAHRAALEAGADAFVSKGDPPDRLLAAIARCRQSQHLRWQQV
jgi:DNA-binding NarL/FixJ family response regulator